MSSEDRHARAIAAFLFALLASGLSVDAQTTSSFPGSLPELKWHLTARPWMPLNTSRTNLLDKVEHIVNALAPLQYWNSADPGDVQDGGDVQNGSIIDPYELKEWQYATPYFSFAVATAVSQARSTNLCEIGARALDQATADIAGLDGSAQANDGHGEFFGPPMMKALRLYKQMALLYPSILTSNRIARWESRLTTSRVSYMNNGVGQNWRTYGMKGEWLRVQDGLIPRTGGAGGQGVDWIEDRWLNEQRTRYVRDRDVLGLNPYFLTYHDDDPGPKQNFAYMGGATGNLLDMIYSGYNGPSRTNIEQITRFCARTCLLLMAGNGDAPAGGRTGDHVWNDVVYGNMFELAAEMAWADGDARLAGQYRRAARLAFQSAWRFQQEQGWFSVTKSLIHPSHQNFYADWSALGNYNGYTEIHSSEAFATELSPIPEQPAPAEIGGYAAILDEQFDNTFVNAGGMQVQICTEGSTVGNLTGGLRWHTLGIVRFSRPGWDTRLGPGDGWIKADGSQAISFAPTFLESNVWQMVSQQPARFIGSFEPTFTHPLLVRSALTISPRSGQTGPSFIMNLTITPDGVLVDTSRTAGTNSFGLVWPLMEFDGKHVLVTNITSHSAATAYPKMSATRTTVEAETATLSDGVSLAAAEANYTGTGYAVFPASGGMISWSGVSGGDGGAATVGFRYTLNQAAATSRSVTLFVNGQPRTINFEHTGTPSTYGGGVLSFPMVWHQLHIPVTLNAGVANTIQLQAGAAGGLNVDEMRVFPADALQPEPDQQNFISLDAAPAIDASTPLRRSAYGDQRPVRVSNADNSVGTFVFPRTASDPTAESVRMSFVRHGTNFTSLLGRVTNNLYVGRTSAGGEANTIDLNGDGVSEVNFSEVCGFVLQTSNSLVAAMEVDRFVTANYHSRQIRLAPYTPIIWSDTATLWNNMSIAATGRHFEVVVNFTPAATNTDVPLGFAGEGSSDVTSLLLGLRFGADGRVTPLLGPGLVELHYQAGISYRIRAEFDLITRRYNLWVKRGVAAELQLVLNAALPASVTSVAELDTFAFLADAVTVSEPIVTPLPELSVTIVSPSAPIVWLNSTNDTLQLSGVISNAPVEMVTTWSLVAGSGAVTFGNSNALTATARFSAAGVYSLMFNVTGTTAIATQAVVVAGVSSAGLEAWWKMDEPSGTSVFDSSGNNRHATNIGATITSGYLSNALSFNGTTSRATYSAQNANRVTVVGWVRCDAQGNSQFPRILDTPSFRLIFRFGSSDVNSVGFATTDTMNGDWDSGAGTISLGPWYHIAVTYDRSNLTNLPAFYVNGTRRTTVTLAMPSGAAPVQSGTGYIGNNSALTRAWSGLIDGLQIYNRVLTAGEVVVLAASPPLNLSPVVSAGTNLTVILPSVANLNGDANDDGKPNPPAMLATMWSQVSGPGVASFANADALNTTASFPFPGSYVLELAADDGQVTTVDNLIVNVLSRPVISWEMLPGTLHVSWPADGGNWRLQSQTNSLGSGLGTNWINVPGAGLTNQASVPIDPNSPAVFFRLTLP